MNLGPAMKCWCNRRCLSGQATDVVVDLTRLLHREPFQMVTAIQQPGHCLSAGDKTPIARRAPDE